MQSFSNTLVVSLLIASGAYGEESEAKAAGVMWAAFECSRFALSAGEQNDANRLFEVGYGQGVKFLRAAHSGSITEEDAKHNVPLGVSLRLGGPSDDFVIGRIYEAAFNDAYDSIVKEDASGLPLEAKDWVVDPELEVSIAKLKYLQANCALL